MSLTSTFTCSLKTSLLKEQGPVTCHALVVWSASRFASLPPACKAVQPGLPFSCLGAWPEWPVSSWSWSPKLEAFSRSYGLAEGVAMAFMLATLPQATTSPVR